VEHPFFLIPIASVFEDSILMNVGKIFFGKIKEFRILFPKNQIILLFLTFNI